MNIWWRRVFPSVQVSPVAARAILDTEAEALNALLAAVGLIGTWFRRTGAARPGVARVGPGNGPARSAGGGLDEGNEADRPQTSRLYPIWDSVVSQVLGTERSHLNPVPGRPFAPTTARCTAGGCRSGRRPASPKRSQRSACSM